MSLQSITTQIMNQIPEAPQTAVILGSGLGSFVDCMEDTISIPYTDIPQYPRPTVLGHAGEWIFGYINKKPLICASGRFHYYEGFSMKEITMPVSVIHGLGCTQLIITSAAGCLNKEWQVGDLMLINGYLDYTFRKSSNSPEIISFEKNVNKLKRIQKRASDLGIMLREGIYTWSMGPSYETPAEIQDIISLGGNAVGMSTVPEMMKTQELGIDIIGISCLTNYGAGIKREKLSHEDVLEISHHVKTKFSRILIEIVMIEPDLNGR